VIGRIFGILDALVGALVVAALIMFLFVGRKYRLPSSAMEPMHCARPKDLVIGKVFAIWWPLQRIRVM